MTNEFLNLLSQNAPGTILGVVVGDAKFACRVRFGQGTNMAAATPWLKEKFCRWAKCTEDRVEWSESLFDFTVEMRLKG